MSEVLNKITHFLKPQPDSYTKKKLYKFDKTIGHGTFGLVKLATKLDTDEKVAIKVILKSSVKDNEKMVYSELETNKKFSHPNIVRFIDWFESKDKFYIVFSLCEGGELFDRLIQRGRFTEKNAKFLINQILLAIEYLHKNNLVHRDLKPENLLFESEAEDSRLMLTDFGISKLLKEDDEVLTTLCGSRGYVAPEVLLRRGYSKPIDMWAVGIITYLLLCGSNPFRIHENTPGLPKAMMEENYQFNPRAWSRISSDAKDFVTKLLKGDPTERMTVGEALKHQWIVGENATSHDLLENVKEEFDARAAYRRAFNKLRAINNIRLHMSHKTDSASSLEVSPELNTFTSLDKENLEE